MLITKQGCESDHTAYCIVLKSGTSVLNIGWACSVCIFLNYVNSSPSFTTCVFLVLICDTEEENDNRSESVKQTA